MIVWNSDLEVGYPMIDSEHQQLIDILNQVMNSMSKAQPDEVLTAAFDRLMDYTKYHFAMEERLMADHAYPDTAAHTAEHARLIRHVEALAAVVGTEAHWAGTRATLLLRDWLRAHILRTDKKLAGFLNASGFRSRQAHPSGLSSTSA